MLDSQEAWAIYQRIAALRVAQRGQPVVMCGTCSGDTRYDPSRSTQSLLCECCGEPMTLRRLEDGSFLISPGLPVITKETAP